MFGVRIKDHITRNSLIDAPWLIQAQQEGRQHAGVHTTFSGLSSRRTPHVRVYDSLIEAQ